jgi:Ca2+-binding EF-hand superfamily protein
MQFTKIVFISSILALASGTAYAAEAPKFKDLDADGSKSLDANEFAKVKAAGIEKSFDELDKNKDGKLDINEYSVLLDEDCE